MTRIEQPAHLDLHLHLAADTTLAIALAAAGVTPDGPVGTAEVWVTTDTASREMRP